MSVTVLKPGQPTPLNTQPGDFLLVHGTRPLSRLIELGQRAKHPRDAARWTHAASLEGPYLSEAQRSGVSRSRADKYDHELRAVIRLDATRHKRDEAAKYLARTVGMEYGFLDFASVALSQLFGFQLIVTTSDALICSQRVAEMLQRIGIFFKEPALTTPADLWAGFVGR